MRIDRRWRQRQIERACMWRSDADDVVARLFVQLCVNGKVSISRCIVSVCTVGR